VDVKGLSPRQGRGAVERRRALARLVKATAGAAVLALGLAACGGSSATLKVSVSSGPVGTLVSVSGTGGPGCVVDKNWLGFDFERQGQDGSTATQMTTQVASNGAWSASFVVPSYLGSTVKAGLGAPVTSGKYEFVAPDCSGHGQAKASFRVTGPARPAGGSYVAIATTTDGQGYWLTQASGRVRAYGDAKLYQPAAAGAAVTAPVVGFARTVDGHGYWLVGANGAVYAYGDARSYGSVPAAASRRAPAVGIASTPDSRGYWVMAADGDVYGFGNAKPVAGPGYDLAPYDAIGARTAGGYIVTAADDGAVYIYPGGALSSGGPGAALGATLVATAVTPSGNGTWQAGSDGGVITSGDATFYGSVPGESVVLEAPVTAIASTPDGHGYWLLGANGSIYNFGDAGFFGPGAQKSK
jgi:hypothetical protein